MCQALIRLQRQAHVYIPLGPHLVDALARNDLITTSAKPGQAALDFTANLKVNKNVLASRTYQDAALKNSIDALMLYAGATAYSAGFPEFVVPIVMQLKLFAKNTQVLPIPPPLPRPLPLPLRLPRPAPRDPKLPFGLRSSTRPPDPRPVASATKKRQCGSATHARSSTSC